MCRYSIVLIIYRPKSRDNVISLVKKRTQNFSVKATSFLYLWPAKDTTDITIYAGHNIFQFYKRAPALRVYFYLIEWEQQICPGADTIREKFERTLPAIRERAWESDYYNRLRAVRRILYVRDEIKLRFHSRASQHRLVSTALPRSLEGGAARSLVPRCWSKGSEHGTVAISHPPSILARRRNLTRPGRSPMSSFPILISTDLSTLIDTHVYIYICFPHDGKGTRGGVLVGVVEALESHLSGICERQQREKNVRPLTFMDSAFTGYTPRMDSRRTPSGENGRPGRKLRPALCLQWRCRCAGPEGIVSNTLEGFLSIGLCARGMSILDTIPDTDNSLCFLRRERLVKVRMREFMIGGFRLVGIF